MPQGPHCECVFACALLPERVRPSENRSLIRPSSDEGQELQCSHLPLANLTILGMRVQHVVSLTKTYRSLRPSFMTPQAVSHAGWP